MQKERFEMILKMLEASPNDSFLNYAAALEFKKNGDSSKSVELFERIQNMDPDYVALYYQLGKLYEASGEIEKALKIYREGKAIAKKMNDKKALGELSEALMFLDENEAGW